MGLPSTDPASVEERLSRLNTGEDRKPSTDPASVEGRLPG